MRKITFNIVKPALVVLMLVFGLTSWGQVTLFSENMGTGAAGNPSVTAYAGFQNNSAMFLGNADVRTTDVSSGYTDASGANNIFITNTSGRYFVITGLNTSSYTSYASLGLSFGFRKSSANTHHITDNDFVVEVSTNYNSIENTGTFTPLTYTTVTTGATWSLVTTTGGTIPLDNNVTIRFRQNQTTAQIRIDDVKLLGYPPVVVPEITNSDPVFEWKVGGSFGHQINAINAPTSYTIINGTLPAGLSLNTSSGLISGAPTEVGDEIYFIEVIATNLYGDSNPVEFLIIISQGDQSIADFVDRISYTTDPSFTLPTHTQQGFPITYTVSNSSVVTVSGNVFTIQGIIGDSTITAYAPGDANWNAFTGSGAIINLMVIKTPGFDIVISQIYSGGGKSSTSPYTHSFVELYNPTNTSISLNGKYLQTAGATTNFSSTSAFYISLPNVTMQPKSYFLIQLASGGSNGVALPTPDTTGALSLISGGYTAKVALTSNLITGSGGTVNPILNPNHILDVVGYGSSVSFSEGNNPAPQGDVANALIRKQGGDQDTNNNGNDFVVATPTPRNSSYGFAIWQTPGEWTSIPAIDKTALIRFPLVVDGTTDVNPLKNRVSFDARHLILETGGELTIDSLRNITVQGSIISNGNFTVKNGANLIQITDPINVGTVSNPIMNPANTGNIKVEVTSNPFKRLDYTFWSSPVVGQGLQPFSPQTLANRIYTYNPANNEYAVATGNFAKGIGYLFRAPNNWSTPALTAYNGEFTGIPHNGIVAIPTTGGTYYGVGNPYPSTIEANALFTLNTSADVMYFWTNTNPPVEGTYLGVPNNYATYTTLGGATASGGTSTPTGKIAVGQGFIVRTTGTSFVFNNSVRSTNQGLFFKTMEEDKHRLWLNLSVENTVLNQTLVGYMEGATEGVDAQIDGEMFGYYGSALYSVIANELADYVIQGRSLPFTDTDVVALGFRATQSGSYTISLANFDGLFTDGQDIYLKDNYTETIHDLKNAAYTFVSEEGVFNDRFKVVYKTTGDLSVNTPQHENKWVVYSKGNGFQIEAQNFEIKEVMVYDMLGRRVYNSNAEGTSHTIANIANGVLIVKVITTDNQTLIRKTAK